MAVSRYLLAVGFGFDVRGREASIFSIVLAWASSRADASPDRHPRSRAKSVLFYYFRKSSHGATNFLHVTVLS
jgi:hypothetical protein